MPNPLRLRIFATHPVQYHVPLWRGLAHHPALDVRVFYFNDQSVRGGVDRGFGVPVKWDVDLLGGYEHEFLSRDIPLEQARSMRIADVGGLLRRERPDWILFSGYTHGFEQQLLRAAPAYGARILMRGEFCDLSFGQRSLPKRVVRDLYLRWFYSRVQRFGTIGKLAKAHLRRLGVRDEQMFFSPYSVDDSVIAHNVASMSREQARATLGIPADRFVFVVSGKLIERKNTFECLDAIARLPSLERVGLIVLGDGEQRAETEARAKSLLGERCLLPGFVNQTKLGPYFLAADALVMPSLHETWGLVVNEAMHYGLPCIVSSQVGSGPDLVEDGRTGYRYPIGNVEMLAYRMQLLMEDPARARGMGAAARKHVQGYTLPVSQKGVLQALGVSLPAASATATFV
jgi:glycosyltransferase involved in cell wall biosynthesis